MRMTVLFGMLWGLSSSDVGADSARGSSSLPPTKEVNVLLVFVCLSVCLLARLLKNASMDLDEMLRVDRRRDTDELINF